MFMPLLCRLGAHTFSPYYHDPNNITCVAYQLQSTSVGWFPDSYSFSMLAMIDVLTAIPTFSLVQDSGYDWKHVYATAAGADKQPDYG